MAGTFSTNQSSTGISEDIVAHGQLVSWSVDSITEDQEKNEPAK